jgi:glutathionylspermidine synthase
MNRIFPECEYLLKSEFTLTALKKIASAPYVSKRFYGREGNSVLYSGDFESEEEF